MHAKALLSFLLPCLLLASACGGDGKAAQTVTSLSGRVVAGPVSGADVTVRPLLNTGALGDVVGTGTTDPEGYYSFDVSGIGPAVVIARGGQYVDEATGSTIVADDLELLSPVVLAGEGEQTAHVTAATTIAARRAMVLAVEPTLDAAAAVENGVAMVEEYYGFEGIVTTLPADLTAGVVPPGPAAEYGALNAGFSQLAHDFDIHLWSLVEALSEDASDGTFDGHFVAGPIYVETTSGGGDLFYEMGGPYLQEAIAIFVGEPRNLSGLAIDEITIDDSIERHERDDFAVCIYQPRIDVVEPPLGLVNEITEVTLRGQFPDLDGVSLAVTFGGVPAEIVKGDDEELQVRAPALSLAGRVDVEVRCDNTHVHGVAQQGFEYYVPGLVPVITGVTPDQGPEAGGTLLEVTGANFDPMAIVEVGGTQAQTIARLGRTFLVVVVPAGTGTKDITVRQEDTMSAPSATIEDAFAYFGRGTGEEPSEAEVAGEWKAYGFGHLAPDTVMLVDSDLVLAGGTFTQSADMWLATPEDPEGTGTTLPQSGVYRVFANGMLWMKPTSTTSAQIVEPSASRAFLSPERDVFVVTNDADSSGPIWLGAGIRRGSGMSNASLSGKWYFGLFSHRFATEIDDRTVSSAWGTAEFDGQGHGSAGLIGAVCGADPGWEDQREAFGAGFAYAVASDGTFTITITPEEDGDDPIVFRGSLAQARDFGVAVSASDAQAQFLMMVPCPAGFTPAHLQGSWYGGGIAYDYEPYDGGISFVGETIRSLHDGRGRGVSEVSIDAESPEYGHEGLATEVHGGETLSEANGFVIGGPDDLSGFIGASRRFQILVPANLEPYPWADAIEFMGAGILVRRPATYSTWTIDGSDYNAVGISTEYKDPGYSLSLEEENTSFRTRLGFVAPTYDDEASDLIGRATEYAGARTEKSIHRSSDGTLSGYITGSYPGSLGPYAVFGDGRMLMALEPTVAEISASFEDMFEEVVGEIAGNGDVIVLRNAPNPEGASGTIVLARVGNPSVDGVYNGGAIRFNYDSTVGEWAEAGFGSMDFDGFVGTVDATGTLLRELPSGYIGHDTESWSQTFSLSGGVLNLGHPAGSLTGIVAPDGAAFFLIDLDETYSTTLLVGMKQPAAGVQSAGSYRISAFSHSYDSYGPIPVEARKVVSSGPWRITDRLDMGFVDDTRTNTRTHVERGTALFADNALAVNPDGSVVWPGGYSSGWLAEGGRLGFLMITDVLDETVYPGAVNLKILTR